MKFSKGIYIVVIMVVLEVKSQFEGVVSEIENSILESNLLLTFEKVLYNSFDIFKKNLKVNPPASQTYVEKIMAAGYQFEEHKVVTEDGYILSIWRIPGKMGDTIKEGKKPIFFLHGLLDDAYTWIVLNPNCSLPIILSDEG